MQHDIERIYRKNVVMRVRFVTLRRAGTVIFLANKKVIEDLFAVGATGNAGILR